MPSAPVSFVSRSGEGRWPVTREERAVREELQALAADDRGRSLLQLALRGIQESGRGLTYGCWVKRDGGVAGCLFQHAHWQGVQEGIFKPATAPKGEIHEYVGDDDFRLVMQAIRAFDMLGRRRFRRWQRGGPLGLPWRRLDEELWRAAVEAILIDVLAGGVREPRAPRPAPALDR
jgi:hypothetical protein